MNELKLTLETTDQVQFWGANNEHYELLKAAFPKLKIVARGNDVKALGDENELKAFEPEVYAKAQQAWEANQDGKLDWDLSMEIPSISIDYAVMERSKKIKVVASQFAWSDLGSFESVYDYLLAQGHPVDAQGNMVIGTDVFSTFIGMRNAIFVATPDANLILQKEQSQDVKYIYNELERLGSDLLN